MDGLGRVNGEREGGGPLVVASARNRSLGGPRGEVSRQETKGPGSRLWGTYMWLNSICARLQKLMW
jgi:hypothetical protein